MKHIFFIFILINLAGCGSDAAQLNMISELPIYQGAYGIDKRKLGRDTNQQLSYNVNEAYPSTEVLSLYDQHFAKHGWEKCTGNMEKWQAFVDATGGQDRLVHQIAHYFTSADEDKLSSVFLRYDSSWSEGKKDPDSDIQSVFVLIQRGIDLQEELKRLSIIC